MVLNLRLLLSEFDEFVDGVLFCVKSRTKRYKSRHGVEGKNEAYIASFPCSIKTILATFIFLESASFESLL